MTKETFIEGELTRIEEKLNEIKESIELIKDSVSKEAYDKLMDIHMKYHNANYGPFNRTLKTLIEEEELKQKG